MRYLDHLYSPEEQAAQATIPDTDFVGRGSAITEHIASTPGLAREMRYSPRNAWNQGAQDYLGPLAAQDFAADARRTGDVGGMLAAAGSPAYVAAKAVAPEAVSQATGTGGAATSAPSFEQVLRAYRGLLSGQGQNADLERAVLEQQVAMRQNPGELTAGRVEYGPDTPWWRGGSFTPNDVLPTAAAALGGVGALAGAAGRGIAAIGARGAQAPAAGAAERMFAPAAQAGYVDPRLLAGGAVAGVGAYGGYKIKQMVDNINAARQRIMDQAK